MAYEDLSDHQKQVVDQQAKSDIEALKKRTQKMKDMKPRTTKQLTQDLVFFNARLNNVEQMLSAVAAKLDNVDAAAYIAVVNLHRKGTLAPIKTFNEKTQMAVAAKIPTTADTIDKFNDKRRDEMVEALNERREQLEKESNESGDESGKQA